MITDMPPPWFLSDHVLYKIDSPCVEFHIYATVCLLEICMIIKNVDVPLAKCRVVAIVFLTSMTVEKISPNPDR